jgi:glycolate oxidase FAD binding subunit
MVTEPEVLEPGDLAGVTAILGASEPPRIRFRGGGTKDDWQLPAQSTVVSTRGLSGVVLHDPADGVAVVRAGSPLSELQEIFARHGQWLAIDPPLVADGATVGGVFSVNDAGPRRLAYGTLRDQVIGAVVVTGDGVVAKTGGRVIKNVAGFDLARLYCGANGTLGLVAELAVRLYPLRSSGGTLRAVCSPRELYSLATAIVAARAEVAALDWYALDLPASGAVGGIGLIRVEQRTRRAAEAQLQRLSILAREAGLSSESLQGDDEDAAWSEVDGVLAGSPADTVVRAVTRPARFPEVVSELARACYDSAFGGEIALSSHAVVGVHTARLRGGDQAPLVSLWRSAVSRLGGHSTLRRRAPGLPAEVGRWGAEPSAIELMRRVKSEFDPAYRCAPGTFVGDI